MKTKAVAFAPASCANVAVGFDLLGFSCDVAGDKVTVERTAEREVSIAGVSGVVTKVPTDPGKNTATAGLVHLIRDLGLDFGFRVSIEKGIPLGSGMGGSAASAVGAIVAANALLPKPLTTEELVPYALIGEAQASGSYHADNVAPSLFGGMTFARVRAGQGVPKVEVVKIPVPAQIHCVLVNPKLSVETKTARGILKGDITLKSHIEQSANLAGFLAGCYSGDVRLIGRSLADVLIEPQRAHLIPGFTRVKESALAHGALGCSISGAGPSVFAWADSTGAASEIKTAMLQAFQAAGVEANGWAFALKREGARIIA